MISHSGIGDLSTSMNVASVQPAPGAGTDPALFIRRIGSRPADEFSRPTFAAGAVLWRPSTAEGAGQGPSDVEIAVVHRPRYDDWSLPKGKVDPGENLAGCAIREIEEETGLTCALGWLLGYVHYPVNTRTKVVYYWTAEVTGGSFTANEEVDELRWLPLEEASALLSYDLDRDVLAHAAQRLALGANRRMLVVRHAKAHERQGWAGDDDLRPLNKKGRRQAEMLVSELSGYRPQAIVSAVPERCQHTAAPLAEELRVQVEVRSDVGDAGWERDPAAVLEAFSEARLSAPVTVVVSQGGAIPGVLEELTGPTGMEIEDLRVKKGSVWVLHFRHDVLVGADYLASALPVK